MNKEDMIPKEFPQFGTKEFNDLASAYFGGDPKQTPQLNISDVSGSLLSDTDYWKQRCLLAEKCLEESPCDPDITSDQIKAWNAYHKFISWAGNNR